MLKSLAIAAGLALGALAIPGAAHAASVPSNATDYYRTRIIGFDAGPEPVKKGRPLTVHGTLQWKGKTWQPLKGAKVKIGFSPGLKKPLTVVATVTTDRYGRWHKTFKAKKSGTWYAVVSFKDTDRYLSIATSGDYVEVR
ncbi:hypothetical protein [Microtetraspora fusca]|uniref:Uncharacterized protein n=1 Tax=Microtetraspora fusca TaxID=1997 RepID=A0ABW6VCA0_MICFU|nr:hypothetical protein [Microtetraspora fusca]